MPASSGPANNVAVENEPEQVWGDCAAAILMRMPQARNASIRVISRCTTNFSPDPNKYPRAFTLHDGGNGEPYVSCPWTGHLRDMLNLAHEFGHALQIVASEQREMPPVTRETCAILAEICYLSFLRDQAHPLHEPLHALVRLDMGPTFARSSNALLSALSDTHLKYEYHWNYPLARSIALLSAAHLDDVALWELYSGEITLPKLISKFE